MKTALLATVVLIAAIAGLVAYDKHKKAAAAAEFEASLVARKEARQALVERRRAAAKKKLDAVDAAIADAKAAPQVGAAAALAAPLKAPLSIAKLRELTPGNTIIVGVSQPEDIKTPLVGPRDLYVERWLDGGQNTTSESTPADALEESFKRLDGVEQVLAVRIHSATAPAMGGGGRFEGGVAHGDAALYDLDSGKRLGAFPFTVTQSDTASIRKDDDANAELLRRFTINVAFALERELTAFIKGESGPAAPGAAVNADLQSFARKIEMEIRLPFTAAMIHSVRIEPGTDGAKPVVVIIAESPKLLQPGGKPSASLVESITKVLGREPELRFEVAQAK
jgi:hypothetical protein